jgi:hypothetical protein
MRAIKQFVGGVLVLMLLTVPIIGVWAIYEYHPPQFVRERAVENGDAHYCYIENTSYGTDTYFVWGPNPGAKSDIPPCK